MNHAKQRHSLSLQTGKPWMIERTEFIESVETWGKDPLASANDNLLCTFVALRLLTAETFDLLPSQKKHSTAHQGRFFSVLKVRIEALEAKWLGVVGAGMHFPWTLQRNFRSNEQAPATPFSSAYTAPTYIYNSSPSPSRKRAFHGPTASAI